MLGEHSQTALIVTLTLAAASVACGEVERDDPRDGGSVDAWPPPADGVALPPRMADFGAPSSRLGFGSARPQPGLILYEGGAVSLAATSRRGETSAIFENALDFATEDTNVEFALAPGTGPVLLALWSDGSPQENAGAAVVFRLSPESGVEWFLRHGMEMTPLGSATPTPLCPDACAGRIEGRWNENHLDVKVFLGATTPIEIAHQSFLVSRRLVGRQAALLTDVVPTRGIRQIEFAPHLPPDVALRIAKDPAWSSDWKVFQRSPEGSADVPVNVLYRAPAGAWLEARVVRSGETIVVSGHDVDAHRLELSPAQLGRATILLRALPAGGNYDVEVALRSPRSAEMMGSDRLASIAVGDLIVAAGQSNLTGYAPLGFEPVEAPSADVHVFSDEYVWAKAEDPIRRHATGRDVVSWETDTPPPGHSALISFGKSFSARTGVPVGLVPTSRYGSALYSFWKRDDLAPRNRSGLYGSMLHRFLLQQGAHPPAGMLWYQGEADAIDPLTNPARFEADSRRFIAQVRQDFAAPTLPIVMAQIATTVIEKDPMRWLLTQDVQRRVAASDPLVAIVATVDLPLADVIHLNAAGYKRLGLRYADALLSLEVGEQPRFETAVVATTCEGRAIGLGFVAPVMGGGGLFAVMDGEGVVPVVGQSLEGTSLTLTLERVTSGTTRVAYGRSDDPAAPWLRTAEGQVVPVFVTDVACPPR
jgi:hypothetical protein